MKIRTMKYMLQEGLSNTYKNFLMSLASVMMVVASLLIFGIFLMISINLTSNIYRITDQDIVVFLDKDIAPLEADDIEQKIKNDERVSRYERVSKEQVLAEIEEMMGDSDLIKGLTPEFLSEKFEIHLKDSGNSDAFSQEIAVLQGVEEVQYPKEFLDKVSLILRWINAGSMFVLAILLIISVSIISNTIKLTVFARRKEIGIMKYIGANDWFIRWPFIIEGMIIGLLGAVLSFVITSYLYRVVEDYVNREAAVYQVSNILRVVPMGNIGGSILFVYLLIGLVMGSVGSIISVRKHLNV